MTFRDANVLYDLIDEARETYVASRGEKVRIFSPDQLSWGHSEEENQIY